jgi:hypothetical protein
MKKKTRLVTTFKEKIDEADNRFEFFLDLLADLEPEEKDAVLVHTRAWYEESKRLRQLEAICN